MSDEPTIDLSQVTGFQDALAQSPQAFIPYAVDAMTESVRLIQGGMAEYPPATEANQPGRFSLKDHKPLGFYQRGLGWWYPIMKKTTLEAAASGKYGKTRGVVKASKLIRAVSQVQGYKLEAGGTSEQLGKSWTADVQSSEDGVTGEVGTNTSYAGDVQGEEQSQVLAKYGWDEHRIDVVVDDLMPDLDEIWSGVADQFVHSLAGA